jgi:CubicO group peptidase (beta-lactamase class C family)
MKNKKNRKPIKRFISAIIFPLSLIVAFGTLLGCRSCFLDLNAVDYKPLSGGSWEVSTPEEQGLDPRLLGDLYRDAAEVSTLYGLLVIKNGRLIGEGYFNEGSIDQLSGRQSATKSFVSALVGVALDQGYLESVDQKMMDFFPEFTDQITDPRKKQITIRHLLEMRAGYPDEQVTPPYMDLLFFSGDFHWVNRLVDFPLQSDPGTEFRYSNLTSHLIGVIVARATGMDLETFAEENLFSQIDAELGGWTMDADGYNIGCIEIYVTARDMAKFGLMYMDGGEYQGSRVLSADWVDESLKPYTEDAWYSKREGRHLHDVGYGYQWWSATSGRHQFDFVMGHGGNLIVLLDELDMIVVTTGDPLHALPGGSGWKYEKQIINLVGKFVKSLPKGIDHE